MQSLRGQLLVASPAVLAPIFSRSVILVLGHNEEGALGIILNKPTNTTMTDLSGKIFDEDFQWDQPLHLGGPVEGPLAVLHTVEAMADGEVIPGVFHTVDAAKVQHVLSQKIEPSLVVANYSGWAPGQLEGEIERDSWILLPALAEHVFWARADDLWRATLKRCNARKLAALLGLRGMPRDPSRN